MSYSKVLYDFSNTEAAKERKRNNYQKLKLSLSLLVFGYLIIAIMTLVFQITLDFRKADNLESLAYVIFFFGLAYFIVIYFTYYFYYWYQYSTIDIKVATDFIEIPEWKKKNQYFFIFSKKSEKISMDHIEKIYWNPRKEFFRIDIKIDSFKKLNLDDISKLLEKSLFIDERTAFLKALEKTGKLEIIDSH